MQAEAILDLKLRHLAKLEEVKIRGEQTELAAEKATLEQTLSSKTTLKALVKKELKADVKTFGDARKSPLMARDLAKVMDYSKRTVAEPITVVLSEKGWVRAGKSHEVDPQNIAYKAGDAYKAHALGTSDQSAVFLDSNGRAYALAAASLPSIRGHGEPLTSRVTPEDGAKFIAVIMEEQTANYLLIANSGYGFIVPFAELLSKNRKGKAIVTLATGAELLAIQAVPEKTDGVQVALVSRDGKLLIFSLQEVPMLAKGKGKKLFAITQQEFAQGIGKIVAATVLPKGYSLRITTAKRNSVIKHDVLKEYVGEAGQKGRKLGKDCQNVMSISAVKEGKS